MLNRRPGPCAGCDAQVPAGAGELTGPPWRVWCRDCKPLTLPVVEVALRGGSATLAPKSYLGSDKFRAYTDACRGARFDRGTKSQVAALDVLPDILARLEDAGFALKIAADVVEALKGAQAEAQQDTAAADERAAEIDAQLQALGGGLYPYQRLGCRWLAPRASALLADDKGLGKTIQALLAAPKGAPIVVVAPAVAKGVWLREVKKWRPDLTPVVLKGRKSFRWAQPGEVVATNYDILSASTKEILEKQAKAARNAGAPVPDPPELAEQRLLLAACPQGTVLIADEAHALKNSKAQRTARFRELAKAVGAKRGRVWLLTGTPLLNRPPELWALLMAMGQASAVFGSWPRFAKLLGGRQETQRFGRREITTWEWDSSRISPEAPRMLQAAMLRRMKADVLTDLPARRYEALAVNGLDKETLRAADEALGILVNKDLEEEARTVAATALTGAEFETMSRARMLLAKAKTMAMLALVEEYEEAEEPVVVCSAHRMPIDALAKRPGWAVITGDTAPAKRSEIEAEFQAGRLKGIGLTIRAGGIAVTLTKASNMIVVDREWTPALNAQAEDRIYRIGQDRGVLVRDLVASHALDERLYQLLRDKQRLISGAVDAGAVDGETDVGAEVEARRDRAITGSAELLAEIEAEQAIWAAKLAKLEAEDERQAAVEQQRAALSKVFRRANVLGLEGASGPQDVLPRRAAAGPVELWAAQAAVALTAMNPDHATVENYMGWNKADGALGHMLAARMGEGLTDLEWTVAIAICRKYHGQIGECPW